jgi:hypothetical protein
MLLGVALTRPTLAGLGAGYIPRTLADRVLEPGGAASCPLMAGSPSLPRKRLFWGGDETGWGTYSALFRR